MRRAGRPPARIGAAAHDLRGAARRVPVGRRRLERRGRDDGGRVGGPGQHVLDRVFGPGVRRVGVGAAVADRYGTRHFVDRVESDDFDLVDALARLYDEPYADSSAIPTYRVCELARQHVTVALSGDGGDESFGGYRRYRLHLTEERMRSALPLSVRQPLFGLLGRAYPKADWAPRVFRAKTTFAGARARLGRGLLPQRVDPARRHAPASCSVDAFKAQARRLQRGRGVPPARAPRRHRRPAGAGPVSRPEDLSGRRHQHQGRPREHGAFARGARAADGPSAGRMARDAARPRSRSAATRASTC